MRRQREAIRGRIAERQVAVAAQLAREEEGHQRALMEAERERQVELDHITIWGLKDGSFL